MGMSREAVTEDETRISYFDLGVGYRLAIFFASYVYLEAILRSDTEKKHKEKRRK